ncbi:unnamed protein product [Aureobasidium vineae]|uniref:Uncharacterized protein n=1 Tax=Aureobasidium vineae TaxID=2773715 RepID=A0A9N8P696_9PEZI|nr:unnamed protein product [Aureobasidium vineae]
MSLAFQSLIRPAVRSFMASLPTRMFHACNADQLSSFKDVDPVKHRERLDQQNAWRRRKLLEDPIKVKNQRRIDYINYFYGKPENAQKVHDRNRKPDAVERRKQYDQKPATRQSAGLRQFIQRRPDIWKHMTWKTHTPVLYEHKIEHRCATCYSNPYLGLRLWWKRHNSPDYGSEHIPDLYECHSCFVADWSRALPVGYEGFVFGQGKTLRLSDMATPPDPKEKGH